jgi:predicted N-acetyltransferase YhbS
MVGGSVPALGLGPIGVVPGHQNRAVGHALMHAVLGAADALDEHLVALSATSASPSTSRTSATSARYSATHIARR